MNEWMNRRYTHTHTTRHTYSQTRAQILHAATRSFLELGYDNITLEHVAKMAGVTKRTLLRYFPSKTHLVLGGHHEALERFRDAVKSRGDKSVIDVWEDHVETNAQWIAEHGDAKAVLYIRV